MSAVLRIQNLETVLHTETTAVRAVDGLTLEIGKGETFALLGESGCRQIHDGTFRDAASARFGRNRERICETGR